MTANEADFIILAATLVVGLFLAAFGGSIAGWWDKW